MNHPCGWFFLAFLSAASRALVTTCAEPVLPPTATPWSLARWPVPCATTASMASRTVLTTAGRRPRSLGGSVFTASVPIFFMKCGRTSRPPLATTAATRAICTGVTDMACPIETDTVSDGYQRVFSARGFRSEEHTSELQSLAYLV